MTLRFPSLFFSILGILGCMAVLVLLFLKVVGGTIPFIEQILISHGYWDVFVISFVVAGVVSVLSLASGLALWKESRFSRFLALITSAITIIIGFLGAFTGIIPLDRSRYLAFFYLSLIPIGVFMLISTVPTWKEIWRKSQ